MGDRNKGRRRARGSSGLAAVIAIAILGLAPTSASAGFPCDTQVVRDYLKPLKGLPFLRKAPASEELPFGPGRLRLSQRGLSPLAVWSENLEFRLWSEQSGTTTNPGLDWNVTASLVRVDRRGQVQDLLHVVVRHLTKLPSRRGVTFRLPFQFKPGLYLFKFVFHNKVGKRLGRFGNYFRALRRNPDHELLLNGTTFQAGQTVTAQAAELGVGWISLNDVYLIESYDGLTWSKASISPKQTSLLLGTMLGPGEATACWDFPVPANASPGLYRFVLEGTTLEKSNGGGLVRGAPLALTSEFNISSTDSLASGQVSF